MLCILISKWVFRMPFTGQINFLDAKTIQEGLFLNLPVTVLIAIKITEVGVETFSLTLEKGKKRFLLIPREKSE